MNATKNLANGFWLFTSYKQVLNIHLILLSSSLFVGYRHIILRNRANRSEGPASVFVRIAVSVSMPAYQEHLRARFSNPLKHLQEQEAARQAFANPMQRSVKRRLPTTPSTVSAPALETSSMSSSTDIHAQTSIDVSTASSAGLTADAD